MNNKPKKAFFILLAIAFIIFIFFERARLHNRETNYSVVEGKITEIGHRAKTDNYVAYTFSVNNIQYFGSVPVKFCNGCNDRCCDIGHKVKVRFEKGNPNNNDLIH